jgi:hypothetical protein
LTVGDKIAMDGGGVSTGSPKPRVWLQVPNINGSKNKASTAAMGIPNLLIDTDILASSITVGRFKAVHLQKLKFLEMNKVFRKYTF